MRMVENEEAHLGISRTAGTSYACARLYWSTETAPPNLLRLQSFDVVGKIRHALLYLAFVPVAHSPE